jgi:hypothetical protein
MAKVGSIQRNDKRKKLVKSLDSHFVRLIKYSVIKIGKGQPSVYHKNKFW